MALISSESATKQNAFKLQDKNSFTNWDAFCVQSLNSAKEEINKRRVFRYGSMDISDTEEARLKHITEGVTDIAEFIVKHGWKIFLTVAIAFTAAAGGAGVAVAGGATLNIPVLIGGISVAAVSGTVGAYYGYKLYKHKTLVIKVKKILVEIKTDFDKFQPGNTKKNRPKIQLLLYSSVKIVIEKIFEVEIMANDLSLPIHPICLCGAILLPMSNTKCYGKKYSYVICDICDNPIQDKKDVYHCLKKKHKMHPHGYDVCIKCARKHNDKFKRYHAVIIQTLPEEAHNGYNVACKDAKALEKVFTALNYHEIIVTKQNKATKKYIMRTLKKMSFNNKNDVVVICYSGHGIKNNNHWMCYLDSNQTITDQEISDCIKGNRDKRNFGATCDIVLLLNACHSGYFQVTGDETFLEEDEQKLPQHLSTYNELGENFVTIAACKENEEGNFVGEISPFFKFVIEELKNNKNATPESIHKYIYEKSNNSNLPDLDMKLSELQNVQRAYEAGKYALCVPLIPAVKTY